MPENNGGNKVPYPLRKMGRSEQPNQAEASDTMMSNSERRCHHVAGQALEHQSGAQSRRRAG